MRPIIVKDNVYSATLKTELSTLSYSKRKNVFCFEMPTKETPRGKTVKLEPQT